MKIKIKKVTKPASKGVKIKSTPIKSPEKPAGKSTKPKLKLKLKKPAGKKPKAPRADEKSLGKVKRPRKHPEGKPFLHYEAKQILAHRQMSSKLQALREEIENTVSYQEAVELMPPGSKRGDEFLLNSKLYRMANYGVEVHCDGPDSPIEFTDPE